MSDSTHALAVTAAGLVMTALGLLLAWHCRRSVRRGELQLSAGLRVARVQNPGWYRFGLVSFVLMTVALVGAGVFCLAEGLRLL